MLIRASGERDWRRYWTELAIVLNGVPQTEVLEADDEAGYIIRYRTGDDGKLIVDGDRYLVERVDGNVMFVGRRRPDFAIVARAQEKRDLRRGRNLDNARRAAEGGAA